MPNAPVAEETEEIQSQQRSTAAGKGRLASRVAIELPGEVTRPSQGPRRGAPPQPPPPAKPAIARPEQPLEASALDQYEEVDTQVVQRILPVFDAMVVYLGSSRRKSVSLRGHMLVEMLEDMDGHITEKLTPVSGEGTQCYDFSSHGTDGRPIRSKLAPATTKDPAFANKPWMRIQHPDHLLWFHKHRETENGPAAFRVLVNPLHRQAWLDFVRDSQRFDAQTGADVALVEQTLKNL